MLCNGHTQYSLLRTVSLIGAVFVKVLGEIGCIITTCFPNAREKTIRGGVEVWVGNCWRIFKEIDSFYNGTQWICHFLTHV